MASVLRPHLLRRAIAPGYDKFAALQAACWCGGTLLYVPAGVRVDRPFHVLSVLTPGGVDLGRCLVVLEEGAEATLLAETAGSDGGGGRPALRRGRAAAGSRLAIALREPAKLGRGRLAFRPSKGRWSAARPPCNGPSAPWEAAWPK